MTHEAKGFPEDSGGKIANHDNSGQREGNGDDEKCCYAFCYPVLFLFCLVKMKPKAKIILTWLYCITGTCIAGGLVALHHSPETLTASPTDMRKVEKKSGIFCEAVQINSTAFLTIYKFKSEPKINETSSLIYEISASTVLTRNSYEYYEYYVLKNSVTTASVCTDNGVSLYTVRGEKNIVTWKKTWRRHAFCSDCVEHKYFFSNCSGIPENVTFKASSSDMYYFLLYADDKEQVSTVNITYTIDRKIYDLEDSYIVCLESLDCDISLSFRVTESIVFYLPRDSRYKTLIISSCRHRYYTYIVLFAVLPFCGGTVVTGVILHRHKQRSRTESQGCGTSNSERLHGNRK